VADPESHDAHARANPASGGGVAVIEPHRVPRVGDVRQPRLDDGQCLVPFDFIEFVGAARSGTRTCKQVL